MSYDKYKIRIQQAKLQLLAEHYAFGIIATAVTSLVLGLVLWNTSNTKNVINWLACVLVLACLRFTHYYYYKSEPSRALNSSTWKSLLYIGLCASGLLWSASILIPSKEDILYLGITIMWCCAIIAGAISSYSFTKKAFISFSTSVVAPILVYLLITPPQLEIYIYMAAGITVMYFYMLSSSFKLHKIIDANLKNINEEVDRNEELNKQKNILNAVADASECLLEETWEQAIPEFLEKLGNNISISRIQIFENSLEETDSETYTKCRFHWSGKDAPEYKFHNITISYSQLGLTRWKNELSARRSILGDINTFPENERHFLKSIDIESLFAVPIFVGNNWWGFICFDECIPGKSWKVDEVNILKTTAAIIGAAIKRSWAENKLSYHASHDSLTGLANRRAFEIYLDKLVLTCGDNRTSHALCYIDLDRFKLINDTCGHSAGDSLLKQIGSLMQQNIRKNDFIARLGGDEFAILLENITLEKAKDIAKNIQKTIDKYSFNWNDRVFRVGASIGIVSINAETKSSDKILQTADNACRAVKISNTNQICVYSVDDTAVDLNRNDAESCNTINNALENGQFKLFLQPICPTNNLDNTHKHYEVLIRMLNDNNSIITPNWFLPTAERYNLISKIDKWVFKACIKTISENNSIYNNLDTLSINISGASLCDPTFLNYVTKIFNKYNIPTELICFEITETIAVSNLTEANNFITELQKLGCRFALDDFGTGFSSFENLKHLPVDYVKIDGIFIRDIDSNKIDYEMVKSLNTISKLMNIKTIAEYVENEEILATVKEIGVDYIQGYVIGEPVPIEAIFLSQKNFKQPLRAIN